MKCTKCGNELSPEQRFCTECGKQVTTLSHEMKNILEESMLQCPECRKVYKNGEKHCTECGHPLEALPSGGEKGFWSRVGAGINSAMDGGSFAQGYARQRDNEQEHEYISLRNKAEAVINKAHFVINELHGNNPGLMSADDESEVNILIGELQNTIRSTFANRNHKNSLIKSAIRSLDNKITKLIAKTNGLSLPLQTVTVCELSDIAADELAVVHKKAIWSIQPGQIARRITERELDSVAQLNGFIIQEGCQAMIFVNGCLVSTMEAGVYNVPQRDEQLMKKEFDKLYAEMEQQEIERLAAAKQNQQSVADRGGLVGIAGNYLRRGWEFIFGVSSARKEKEDKERVERLKVEVEKALKVRYAGPIMSVIIVSKRNISLSFGGVDTGDGIKYRPYTVPVGFFDAQVGILLQLKVTDIKQFAVNYLADKNSCTTNDFFNLLNMPIENALRQNLRNADYTQGRLEPALVENLKHFIADVINSQLFGIECAQVLQITDRNNDFDRFRQVERELYCSEKELDFLQRSGEFSNRLEQETNRQQVNSARNEEDLSYALQQINKDHLLHEDEMAEFVLLLECQRRIREARSEEEEYAALQDLRKSRLVKDDEVAVLEDALYQKKIQRESITEVMRIQNQLDMDLARFKAEWVLDDTKQDHDWEREDLARRRNWGIADEERERRWLIEDKQLQRQFAQEKERVVHENWKVDIEIGTAKKKDEYMLDKDRKVFDAEHDRKLREYEFDWKQKEDEDRRRRENERIAYERERQNKQDELEALRIKSEIANRNMQLMEEADLKKKQEENRSAEEIHRMDAQVAINRDNVEATMSPEALMAKVAAELSNEGQVELAKALGSVNTNDLQRAHQSEKDALYQQMIQTLQMQSNLSQQQMMTVMDKIQQTMVSMANANMASQQAIFNQQQQVQQQRYNDVLKQKDEYRDDSRSQQNRMDNLQQQALDYTTRAHQTDSQSFAQAMGGMPANFRAFRQDEPEKPATVNKQCPACGTVNKPDAKFCAACGKEQK